MARFLLVPGAWHGAWCWSRLTPLLQQAGHEVVTPDLATPAPGANPLPIWAQQIAGLAQAAPEPVILVGHSRGGMVISEAATRAPNKIRTLVYLSAFLLPAGESLQSAMAWPEAGDAPDYLRPARGRCLSLAPDAIIPRFYHLASLPLAQEAAARLHPEPMGTFAAASTISPDQISPSRRVYIECSADRVIPLPLQRAMQAKLPCANVLTLPSDHSPFICLPDQLADHLNRIAAAFEP